MAGSLIMAAGYFSWSLLLGLVVGSKPLNLTSFSLLSCIYFLFLFLLKENFLLFLQRWCGHDMALVWSVSVELYCSVGA